MEETGIIRRLDALGRIVIPREFRKLNRIEVGDPIEMRALAGGEIVIRKVDVASRLKTMGSLALDALSQKTDKLIGVCSLERWLQFSSKCELAGEELSKAVADAVNDTRSSVVKCDEDDKKAITKYIAVFPVYGETGVFGALALFTDTQPDAFEKALMETVAVFTGKNLQTF